jgi:hypothetical protein
MQISASSMGYHCGIVDSSKFPTSRYLPDFASECVYLRPWPFNRTRCMSLYFMNVFFKMFPQIHGFQEKEKRPSAVYAYGMQSLRSQPWRVLCRLLCRRLVVVVSVLINVKFALLCWLLLNRGRRRDRYHRRGSRGR